MLVAVLVAHLGGDYTIRERGGLTLNPLQYVDPVMSLALPAIILAIGGIPLPGGVTYIRRDLLRSRAWEAGVSAAGPAMNFLLFIALSLPFHPAIGWVDTRAPAGEYQTWQIFLAAMAQLQMIAVILNLVPIPPLDGFNLISPWLKPDLREKLSTPPFSTIAFVVFLLVLWRSPEPIRAIYRLTMHIQMALGFDFDAIDMMARCYNIALFGSG